MKNKVKPTKLQKATVEILKENPKMPIGKAMRQAGYAVSTSKIPSINFLDLKGTQIARQDWIRELRGAGLGESKIKEKLAEWIDATKVQSSMTEPDKIVPDYSTQLKAGEMIRKDLGLEQEQSNLTQINFDNSKIEVINYGNKDKNTV